MLLSIVFVAALFSALVNAEDCQDEFYPADQVYEMTKNSYDQMCTTASGYKCKSYTLISKKCSDIEDIDDRTKCQDDLKRCLVQKGNECISKTNIYTGKLNEVIKDLIEKHECHEGKVGFLETIFDNFRKRGGLFGLFASPLSDQPSTQDPFDEFVDKACFNRFAGVDRKELHCSQLSGRDCIVYIAARNQLVSDINTAGGEASTCMNKVIKDVDEGQDDCDTY